MMESEVRDEVCDFDNLYRAMQHCKNNVMWKDSVAGYVKKGLVNVHKLKESVENGTYKLDAYTQFMTKEEVDRCYESWKAHVGNESSKKRKSPGRRARRNCHNLIICMDQYYKNLWRESKCLDLSVQENSL